MTSASTRPPALEGIRVLELGHAIAAPHCAQILADQGADVIRIEPPGGDRTRRALPVVDGDSFYFASHNRRKRSVILDLKRPRGRQLFLRLADTADVLVTNYGAGVPDRLGIGYETLSARNPGMVFVHITGFGSDGPYRDFGAYDGIIQAMSGIPAVTGPAEGPPTFVGAFVADHLAATQAAVGALLALHRRTATGAGSFVDIGMLEGYFGTLAHHVASALDGTAEPRATGNAVPTAFANTFRAADGFVYAAPLSPRAWQAFCDVVEAPNWLREANRRWTIEEGRPEVEAIVESWTARRSRDEIIAELRAAGVPCGPVNDVVEAVRDPGLASRRAVVDVVMPSGRSVHVPAPIVRFDQQGDDGPAAVPAAGQDTAQVLRELGCTDSDFEALVADGVVEGSRT